MDFMQAGTAFFVAGTIAFAIYIYDFIMANYESYKIRKGIQEHEDECIECQIDELKERLKEDDRER